MARSRAGTAGVLAWIAAFACGAPGLADERVSAAFAAKIDAAAAAALNVEIARLQRQDADAAVVEGETPQGPPSLVPSIPTPGAAATLAAAAQAADISEVRAELRRIGCYSGGDVDWSAPEMRDGVARYARYANLGSPPAAPTAALLEELKRHGAGFCPPQCSAREAVVDGRCVAKTCAAGELLDASGACVAKPASKSRVVPARAAAAPAKRSSATRCFVFNGSPFCE